MNKLKMSQGQLLEWAEKHAYTNKLEGKEYPKFICDIMNKFDERVHGDCHWAFPYGWVPEAGCEKHGD